MGSSPLPAWPFLVGALLALGLGVWQVLGGNVIGWVLMALGLALFALAVRQGRQALAAAASDEGSGEPPAVPAASSAKEGGSGLSAYYENEAAVRAMQKDARRLCKECGSPVLANASECPTCGSRV
jgi:DNA-directed RNA polymerase subunit RPC12/RpoP